MRFLEMWLREVECAQEVTIAHQDRMQLYLALADTIVRTLVNQTNQELAKQATTVPQLP